MGGRTRRKRVTPNLRDAVNAFMEREVRRVDAAAAAAEAAEDAARRAHLEATITADRLTERVPKPRRAPRRPFRPTWRSPADFQPAPPAGTAARRVREFQRQADDNERLAEYAENEVEQAKRRRIQTEPATRTRVVNNAEASRLWQQESLDIARRIRADDAADGRRRRSMVKLAEAVLIELPGYLRQPAAKTLRVWLGKSLKP